MRLGVEKERNGKEKKEGKEWEQKIRARKSRTTSVQRVACMRAVRAVHVHVSPCACECAQSSTISAAAFTKTRDG
eukprot:3843378-Pleurochrysis_carterae.AAC.1